VRLLRKKILRYLALAIIPFIGSLLIRFIYATNKKEFHIDVEVDEKPTIFACWHGELLMLPYAYKYFRKTPYAKVLISPHFDGKLISKTIKYFSLETIAGSSDKNPSRTLIQAMKSLKEGYDIGITPDGPKGPRHKVANGIIAMSQKTDASIMLLNIKATKYWQLNSWDKFMIPKPFGTLHYYASKISNLKELPIDEARELVENQLNRYES